MNKGLLALPRSALPERKLAASPLRFAADKAKPSVQGQSPGPSPRHSCKPARSISHGNGFAALPRCAPLEREFLALSPSGLLERELLALSPSGLLERELLALSPSGLLERELLALSPFGLFERELLALSPSGLLERELLALSPSGLLERELLALSPSGLLERELLALSPSGLFERECTRGVPVSGAGAYPPAAVPNRVRSFSKTCCRSRGDMAHAVHCLF